MSIPTEMYVQAISTGYNVEIGLKQPAEQILSTLRPSPRANTAAPPVTTKSTSTMFKRVGLTEAPLISLTSKPEREKKSIPAVVHEALCLGVEASCRA